MTLRRSSKSKRQADTSVAGWSVADLADLYSVQRPGLVAQANRVIHSPADAVEIVQEAFLKFILAAPELDSKERALAYLRTTVNNLCFNHLRARGRRPEVVAIDSESSNMILDELSYSTHIPFDAVLASAEDAAIVRGALSRLPAEQRAALVMWEMEGRSTQEIAKALGTSEENVRHVVSRSRGSFVRVLSDWVIDEESGSTALEYLSDSYKRAAIIARKSSGAGIGVILLFAAIFGYSANGGHISSQVSNSPGYSAVGPSSASQSGPTVPDMSMGSITGGAIASGVSTPHSPKASSSSKPTGKVPITSLGDPKTPNGYNLYGSKGFASVMVPAVIYPGVDSSGVPTGFRVTDLSGDTGDLIVGEPVAVVSLDKIVLNAPAISYDPKAVNVILNQVITVTGSGSSYEPTASVSMGGRWIELTPSSVSTSIVRLPDGNYMIDSTIVVSGHVDSIGIFPVSQGVDVAYVPTSISSRLVLNPGKTQILAESIKVMASGGAAVNIIKR